MAAVFPREVTAFTSAPLLKRSSTDFWSPFKHASASGGNACVFIYVCRGPGPLHFILLAFGHVATFTEPRLLFLIIDEIRMISILYIKMLIFEKIKKAILSVKMPLEMFLTPVKR